VPPQVWTQGASIRWRPEFKFYESRTGFLSRLEEKNLIHAWRIAEDEVGVRLGDDDHEAILSQAAITVIATTLEPKIDRLMTAVELAVAEIKLLGQFAETLGVLDYAFLIDGHQEESLYDYQAEFGVVSRKEVPLRLSRMVSRIRSDENGRLPNQLETSKLPRVSLYVESRWELRPEQGTDVVQSLGKLWTDSRQEADSLVEQIRLTVAGGS